MEIEVENRPVTKITLSAEEVSILICDFANDRYHYSDTTTTFIDSLLAADQRNSVEIVKPGS